MSSVFEFFLYGLGSGGLYALVALGVVLVYRGSGIVNFAAGAFALFGASIYFETQGPLGSLGALIAAVVGTAAFGLLVQLLVMRPMRRSSPLARVVATLAILTAVEQGALLLYGSSTIFVSSLLPTTTIGVFGAAIGENYFIVFGIAAVLLVALGVTYRRTRFGLLTSAVAENEIITSAQGWSPQIIAAGNWALGGALAGLAGALLVPITGLSASSLALTIVPVLAAALVGGFSSFTLTAVGALLIGVLQSEADRYITATGWSDAIPFIVIICILVVRGKSLPLRSHLTDRLPRLGMGRVSVGKAVTVLVVIGVTLSIFSVSWSAAVTTSAIFAVLCLSTVVVTGLCGQLSLAQFAMAGIGALVAGRLADLYHIPFLLALLIGAVAVIPVGLIVGLPALRVRGINLAVLTMGLATVVSSVVLNNPSYTGGLLHGTVVPTPKIFGLAVDSIGHPQRYAWVCLAILVLAALMVCNIRRGRSGRRMIAVRDNERAAVSLGVSVVGAKLYAFSFAAALAAVGGILIAFTNPQVDFSSYDVFSGINLVLTTVLGGVGYVLGAFVGGTASVGGVAQELIGHVVPIGNWFLFISAMVVLVDLVFLPDGIARALAQQWEMVAVATRRILPVRPKMSPVPERLNMEKPKNVALLPDATGSGKRATSNNGPFELRGITVRFGGAIALDDVSFSVNRGEVVGLIGPNGAGKTTLVDVATGYVRPTAGTVTLGERPLSRLSVSKRARTGITRSFQSLELFEDLTVADNLRVASDRRDALAYITDLVHPGRPPMSPVTRAVVDEFQLHDVLDHLPESLSYAQRRLVAIARAVATAPEVLLLDEPAAGLDDVSTRELGILIRRLAREWGMGVVLIEHDVPLVLNTCDRVVVLDFGKVVAEGDPERIRRDPVVVKAYLGLEGPDAFGTKDEAQMAPSAQFSRPGTA